MIFAERQPPHWSRLSVAMAAIFLVSCSLQRDRQMEEPPPPGTGTPAVSVPVKPPELPPPTAAEVRSKVGRIFGAAVVIDARRAPYFIVGDFNGDFSEDLVVALNPAPDRSSEIEDELASWVLVDPMRPPVGRGKLSLRPEVRREIEMRRRVRVEAGSALLGIIHGFGSRGWRNREATQAYVLKTSASGSMATQLYGQTVTPENKEALPRIWGDVIALTVSGRPGFLYYNGAKYAWYDPTGYKPEQPIRTGHGRE
jgi:hypothetical protein